jgi:integrase
MDKRNNKWITKLPSGRYQIGYHDANGVKHRESFDRYKEAERALNEHRTAVRNREFIAPAKIPTVEQAARSWLEGKKVSESKHGGPVKQSSIEHWQNHIDTYIVPTLGNYRMDVVDTALVEKKRDDWKALGSLSGKTVNKVMTTLDAIFQKQLTFRTIRYNPVSVAERMARGSNEVGQNDELDIDSLEVRPEEVYNPDELCRLFAAANAGFDRTILTVFAMTGARHGEALALMWRDQNGGEIVIRRNWSDEYRGGEPVFWTPKTKNSIRRIPISNELSLELKKWKLQSPPSKYDLVFPQADGRPQNRKFVWRALDRAIKKANHGKREDEALRRLTIHSLRHSFASIHLMNGTPITEVSAMLGHADATTTLRVYSHFIPKMRTDSAARFAASIFSPSVAAVESTGTQHAK